MRETTRARQAFENYFELGDARSLAALAAAYQERVQSGTKPGPPTTHLATLKKWSAEHGWQDRLGARIAEEAARVQVLVRERADKFRARLITALEADAQWYVQWLADHPGEPMLIADAASLERVVKLYFQLVGQPLAERFEHTGAGPVILVPVFGPNNPLGAGRAGDGGGDQAQEITGEAAS